MTTMYYEKWDKADDLLQAEPGDQILLPSHRYIGLNFEPIKKAARNSLVSSDPSWIQFWDRFERGRQEGCETCKRLTTRKAQATARGNVRGSEQGRDVDKQRRRQGRRVDIEIENHEKDEDFLNEHHAVNVLEYMHPLLPEQLGRAPDARNEFDRQ